MTPTDKHKEIVDQASRLGTLLIREGLLTEEQLRHALKVQSIGSEPLGNVLVGSNVITRYQLHRTLHHQHKLRTAIAALMTLGALALPETAEADTSGSVTLHGYISPTVTVEAVAQATAQAVSLNEIHAQGRLPEIFVNATRDWSGYQVAVTGADEQNPIASKQDRLAVTVTVN